MSLHVQNTENILKDVNLHVMCIVTVIIGFILLLVKILYLIDWVIFYSSLQGDRGLERVRG